MKHLYRSMPSLAAALLAVALSSGTGDAQTIIDETDDNFRARVTLAPALSAEPGLAGFLREEAEETVALYRDIAREAASSGDGTGISVEIADRLMILTRDYASVLRQISIQDGGRQTDLLEALTTDRRSGQFLRLDAFLGGPDGRRILNEIAKTLESDIARLGHGGSPSGDWPRIIRAATRPDLTVLQNFTLVSDTADTSRIGAIVFHFAPGSVAPRSAGAIAIAISAAQLRAGLKPDVADRFAR